VLFHLHESHRDCDCSQYRCDCWTFTKSSGENGVEIVEFGLRCGLSFGLRAKDQNNGFLISPISAAWYLRYQRAVATVGKPANRAHLETRHYRQYRLCSTPRISEVASVSTPVSSRLAKITQSLLPVSQTIRITSGHVRDDWSRRRQRRIL